MGVCAPRPRIGSRRLQPGRLQQARPSRRVNNDGCLNRVELGRHDLTRDRPGSQHLERCLICLGPRWSTPAGNLTTMDRTVTELFPS